MIVKNKIVNVYDIEVFPNCIHVTVKNTEDDTYHKFEISTRRNDINELYVYFKTKSFIFVGYNNHHYDDLIINYLIDYYHTMKNMFYLRICNSVYRMSQIIVDKDDDKQNLLKQFKYSKNFDSFDLLTMLFSEKLRVGLKEMQLSMQYKNVQEYSGDFNLSISENEIDKMIEYNINDVDSTTELLVRCKKDIELRLWIEQEYKVDALSMDSVKFGETILAKEYCRKTGISMYTLKQLRSPMEYIPLKDVIFNFIDYKNPILKDVLQDMKRQTIHINETSKEKNYEKKFVLSNICYSVGVGGIHSINKPEIFIPKEDEYIGHADVTSMYPSLLIKYQLTPQHLGKTFLDIYSQFFVERVEAKHSGQKLKDKALKLTLNSVTGKMQQSVSWLYDPFNVFRIRINGQLILLMLVERLLEKGCKIIQVNTDGVMYIGKKENIDNIQDAITDVEHITKLSFEVGRYEAFYQYAVNDYFGVIEGFSKTHDENLIEKKGMFITDIKLGKGLAPTIIPKAVINFFINKIPVREYITHCDNIHDFLIGQRVDKKFKVEYNDKVINRINRFYASNSGYPLLKFKINNDGSKSYTNLLKDSPVKIFNKITKEKIKNLKINYDYYVKEASDIINNLRCKELPLFDY